MIPLPRPRPLPFGAKPKRLPERKRMTIAIGLMAKNGLVLAADTQESMGSFKMDEPKILIANKGQSGSNSGAIAVSGAGWGGHLDSINQEICGIFLKRSRWTIDQFETAIKKQNSRFYRDHITPLTGLPYGERPEYSLILGSLLPSGKSALWGSSNSTVKRYRSFGAVGLGAAFAKMLLSRLWTSVNVEVTACLAAYVMYLVKQYQDGCGNETHIVILKNGHARYMTHGKVEMYEHSFPDFMAYENRALHFALGISPLSEIDDLKQQLEGLRTRIVFTHRTGVATWQAGIRTTDQPEMGSTNAEGE